MRKITLIIIIMVGSLVVHAQQIPDFYLNDIANNSRSFEDLKGENLTLFDFWATWCKPCRKAIPELNKIYDAYKDKGVAIVGVNCDGPRSIAKVEPMAKSLNIKYPVLLDINSELINDLNISNFPTLIAVNDRGKVVYLHEGFALGDEIEIIEAIDELLAE